MRILPLLQSCFMVHKSSRLPIRLVSPQKSRCSLTLNVLSDTSFWARTLCPQSEPGPVKIPLQRGRAAHRNIESCSSCKTRDYCRNLQTWGELIQQQGTVLQRSLRAPGEGWLLQPSPAAWHRFTKSSAVWFALVEAQGVDFVSMTSLVWSYPHPLPLLQVPPKADLDTPQDIPTNVYSQIYSISVEGKPSCESTLGSSLLPLPSGGIGLVTWNWNNTCFDGSHRPALPATGLNVLVADGVAEGDAQPVVSPWQLQLKHMIKVPPCEMS